MYQKYAILSMTCFSIRQIVTDCHYSSDTEAFEACFRFHPCDV